MTFTVTVHDDDAGTLIPDKVRLAPPAEALTVPVHPVPVMAADGVPVLTSPAG